MGEEPHPSTIIAFIAAGLFSGVTLMAWTDFAVLNAQWCIVGEQHCLREWVSALSGWAAFIGAAVAVPYLAAQVREARRQTEFTIGDALPTVVLDEAPNDIFTARLRVTNWNRRDVFVERIEPDQSTGLDLEYLEYSDPRTGSDRNELAEKFKGATIDGWTDRNQAPPQFEVKFHAIANVEHEGFVEKQPLAVFVTLVLVGNRHERIRLYAHAPAISGIY